MNEPINKEHYHPLERPRMYPLELDDRLHICLWDEEGKYKWSIAMWKADSEGYDLHFIGDRPLNNRVDWVKLRAIIRQGQLMADTMWDMSKEDGK